MREYILTHSPIDKVYFNKNSNNFVVNEIPLYEFSNQGEHLVLYMQKKDLTTWQALGDLSKFLGVNIKEFGYAGLKDKDGLTRQYISIHKSHEKKLDDFFHEKIKILSKTYHDNKIKIGHLKKNNFFIKLKKVNKIDALKIEQALSNLLKTGFPNFFGYQRFGIEENNYLEGKQILEGKKNIKNKKLKNFLISSYQSYLFNNWLSKRLSLSKESGEIFKLLKGDILMHYPFGKAFLCKDLETEKQRFQNHDISPTGLIFGQKCKMSEFDAKKFEDEIFDETKNFTHKLNGQRRYAISFLEDVKVKYDEENARLSLEFSLQKGSYATIVLEQILKTNLQNIMK